MNLQDMIPVYPADGQAPAGSGNIRIRDHKVAYQSIEIVTSGDELSESPAGGSKRIELLDG